MGPVRGAGFIWVLAAATLAGCSQAPPDGGPATVADAEEPPTAEAPGAGNASVAVDDDADPVVLFTATGCREGGSHSAYSMSDDARDGPVEPWMQADAYERLGRPAMTSLGPHTGGPVRGNWAPVLECASWSDGGEEQTGFMWAVTATLVEAPAFDPGGADLHYLVELLSVHDSGLADALEAAGVPVGRSTGEVYEWLPGDVLHTKVRYGAAAEYDAYLHMRPLGPRADEVVRFWVVAERDDGTYRPVSVDVQDAGGQHWVGDPAAAGAAYRQDLDGSPPVTPGAPMPGLAFEGFTRTAWVGPQPDVTLPAKWER